MSNKLILIKLLELWKAHKESQKMAIADAGAMSIASRDWLNFGNFESENKERIMAAIQELLEGPPQPTAQAGRE